MLWWKFDESFTRPAERVCSISIGKLPFDYGQAYAMLFLWCQSQQWGPALNSSVQIRKQNILNVEFFPVFPRWPHVVN